MGVHEASVEEEGTVGVLCAGFEEAFGEVSSCCCRSRFASFRRGRIR